MLFYRYYFYLYYVSVQCKSNISCKNFRDIIASRIWESDRPLSYGDLRTRRFPFVYRCSEKCSRQIRFVSGRKVKNKARLRELAVINLRIPSENPACTLKTGHSLGVLAVRSQIFVERIIQEAFQFGIFIQKVDNFSRRLFFPTVGSHDQKQMPVATHAIPVFP